MANAASANTIAAVGRLVGEPARANLLVALMGGRALTAGELAGYAGVTPQTTSGHLAKLADARLIVCERHGRHRYYRLAGPEIAEAMRALMVVAASGPKRHHPVGPRDAALRLARTCYDHMAGRLALAIADALGDRGDVVLSDGAGLISVTGQKVLRDFGLDLDAGIAARRPLCRTCLDWSERRPHLAGWLGAALLDRSLKLGWVARIAGSRALRITPAGEAGFRTTFGLPSDWRVADNGPDRIHATEMGHDRTR